LVLVKKPIKFVAMLVAGIIVIGILCFALGVCVVLLVRDYMEQRQAPDHEHFVDTRPPKSFQSNKIMLEKALKEPTPAKPPRKELSESEKTATEDAIFDERERLKNTIHDFTVQQLVATRSQLDDLLLYQTSERAETITRHLHDELGKTIDSLRYLIYNLHLPMFELKTLSELIEEMRIQSNRFVRFKIYTKEICEENRFPLTTKQKEELYMIIQESLQNSIKYSDGGQFHIWLDWTDGLVLTTEDVGFGLRMIRGLGSGILSMKARAESIGATFNIDAYKTQGTLVTVKLPR
jgi:signal transduction histidine kinase